MFTILIVAMISMENVHIYENSCYFKYIKFVICQLNINKCANKRKYLLSS